MCEICGATFDEIVSFVHRKPQNMAEGNKRCEQKRVFADRNSQPREDVSPHVHLTDPHGPSQTPGDTFLVKIDRLFLKFTWKYKGSSVPQTTWGPWAQQEDSAA